MAKSQMSMKLLIDRSKRRVLFAEAGKDAVDFLFHILSLPLGTVVGFLSKEAMAGSIGTLYGSLEGLGVDYLQDGLNKDCLLNPTPASGSASNIPLLTTKPAAADPAAKTFYACSNTNYNHAYVSDAAGTMCPKCQSQMNRAMTYVAPPADVKAKEKSNLGGYVKGVVTYMIMDDLSVQPMSKISSIKLLNKFSVQDVSRRSRLDVSRQSRLDEKEVTLDMNLGVSMLKASLTSKTVLTDVFLTRRFATASVNRRMH